MKPDFSKIDIKQVSASKVVGPNNADWQTPELIDVKPIYTKEDVRYPAVLKRPVFRDVPIKTLDHPSVRRILHR